MRIRFEDFIAPIDWEHIRKVAKRRRFNHMENDWILLFWYIGIREKLADYQARSFASEMNLFLNGEIHFTDVEEIYNEFQLDSFLQLLFQEFAKIYDIESTDFWLRFKEMLLNFYRSSESWNYERCNYRVNLTLTADEVEKLDGLKMKSRRFAVRRLLQEYDFSINESCVPPDRGRTCRTSSAYLSLSEYNLFKEVYGQSNSMKFLQIFYYFFK